MRRSPSWGARIENLYIMSHVVTKSSRSPSWGARIEKRANAERALAYIVAPPRGERGLKYLLFV